MSFSLLFSLIFFLAGDIFFFLGALIYTSNSKSRIHRTFFCCCLSLCIWSYAFCISNSAPSYEAAMFWHRVATLGWGLFFGFLPHAILILTEKYELLRKKWIFALLYIPAAINIFIFGLCTKTAVPQYKMVYTTIGWVNTQTGTFWDILFNIYFVCICITSIGLLLDWGLRTNDPIAKKQSILVCASFTVTAIFGSMTEFTINSRYSLKVPQLAPVLILLPVCFIFYCIKRYGYILRREKLEVIEGQILNESTRSTLYRYLMQACFFGAFLNIFIDHFIRGNPIGSLLIFSTFLFSIGLFLMIIQNINIRPHLRDLISEAIMVLSIPVMGLEFEEMSPAFSLVIPFLLVLISVTFHRRRMLTMIGTTTVLTQFCLLYRAYTRSSTIDIIESAVCILFVLLILWVAYYIHHLYLKRLAENEAQVRFQKLLTTISASFVTADEGNIEEKLNDMLRVSSAYFNADRALLLLLPNSQEHDNPVFEWYGDGIVPVHDLLVRLDDKSYGPWLDLRFPGHSDYIYIPDKNMIPELHPELSWMLETNIQSMLLYPIRSAETIIGILSFEAICKAASWKEEQIAALNLFANLITDVWLKVKAEKEVRYRAYYDTLTGLPNREMFKKSLEATILSATCDESLIGVAFIDLDSFKSVNDSIGHDGGDLLLVKMGQRLAASIRPIDVVARFGGDEFIVMISQAGDFNEIRRIIEQILQSFDTPLTVKNQEFYISASMGVSVFPFDGKSMGDLIKYADIAMYLSKQNGKNRYTFCTSEMKESFAINTELTNSLYHALEQNELLLYYQPQVNGITGEIVGMEALIRWKHPYRGFIAPSVFIPIAEKTGLINAIGHWVLYEACHQNKTWQDHGLPPIKIAVNLSLGQFHNPKLVEVVESILTESGLKPCYLELEITESIATREQELIIGTLNRLKELGVTISIDDFGTEYSSLSRLKTLPIDGIKIDMQFIHGIRSYVTRSNGTEPQGTASYDTESHGVATGSSKDEDILKVILRLGNSLGLKVVAEGVETKEQLVFLNENACEVIQGYYFYKPMTADEIEALLIEKSR